MFATSGTYPWSFVTLVITTNDTHICRFKITNMVRVVITLTDLTTPYCCACPKSEPEFLMSLSIFMFIELRREVKVRFVDIGGILYHHCLNFFFRGDCSLC